MSFLPPGLDQDWSAIAATQCRLDKEGATKLVCDLITSTKNEKIFQESIGLAIRLLDGGNTEIQVCQSLRPCGRASSPRGQCQSNYLAALPPVSALCHVALFHPTPLCCSIPAWACCPPSLPQLCPPFLPRSLCSGLLPCPPICSLAFGIQLKTCFLQKPSLMVLPLFIYLFIRSDKFMLSECLLCAWQCSRL